MLTHELASQRRYVIMPPNMRPVLGQNLPAKQVNLALAHDLKPAGALKAQSDAADSRE